MKNRLVYRYYKTLRGHINMTSTLHHILAGNQQQYLSLQNYAKKKMYCPVTANKEQCYYIPLEEIEDKKFNPARAGGTQSQAVEAIFDSIVTSSDGQEEPICLQLTLCHIFPLY